MAGCCVIDVLLRKICFRSALDQACLWAVPAAGLGVPDGGFEYCIVLESLRTIDMVGVGDASKKFIPDALINTLPTKIT